MNHIITLLKPRVWSLINKCLSKKNNDNWSLKLLLFGVIGIFFWGGVFAVSLRVLGYFKGIEELGDLLAYKLLSMILLTFFSLLIFSSIITSLSKIQDCSGMLLQWSKNYLRTIWIKNRMNTIKKTSYF